MPCILSRAARWFGLRVLLACLFIALATCVHASNVKIIIPEPDVDWPWKPQLNLSIPDEYFTGAASSLTDADQWRVLSYVGAPFRISSSSSDDLMQVLELVAFMRADGRGQCPHYTTSYRTHYYRFHYAELELLYGEARWAALQRLQEPSTWSLVLTEAVGPAVREAEHVLAKRRVIDPPGLVLVNMREENGAVSQVRVPLGDFRVSERVFLPGHRLEYSMPQLTIDWEAGHRRRHLHYFLQTKEKFTAQVAAFDAATLRAQRQLQESLESLQQSEQRAYDANAGFKMRYQRFLKERQQRTSLSGAGGTGNASDTHLGSPVRRVIPIQAAAPQARTPPARQAVACRKVTAAWATLVQNGLRWSEDRRAVQLRRLHVRHGCPTALSPLPGVRRLQEEEGAVKQSEGGQPALTLAAQRAWRIAVAEMMAQRAKSGRPPTFAQLFAALFGVWEAEREGEVTRLNATTSAATNAGAAAAAEKSALVVSADFVRFVDTFLESGEAVAVAGGRLPRHIRAELHYLLGILHLVSHNTAANIPSSLPGSSVSGVVRGVLHLHESLGSGSHHAAGALATLREHGIFTRQHTKAAMQLLLRSMQTSPSYLLRQLLHTPRFRSGAAAAAAAASPSIGPSAASLKDPSRLLRFEQFYAVDHTLQEVDDPFMTRESVRTMVAITHENTHSTDDAPELEDVYREAAAERGSDGGNEGSITARLSRRALKANILLSGFKDTPRDAGEAECELLVVLRQLGYFCDVDLRSLLSSQRARGGGGAAGRLRTAMGPPFPPSCPEHAAEVFRVLGNPRHTLLQCSSPSGGTAAAAAAVPLPTHTPAHLSVPTSETLYSMLHTTLLSLSYVHLLHSGNYEMSHLYASLSLEMSLRLQQLLVKRFGRVRQLGRQLKSAAQGSDNASAGVSSSSSSPLSPYEALLTLAEGSDEVAFAAEMLADDVEAATERAEGAAGKAKRPRTSPDALAQRAVERCRSVADSPFVYTEALLLLGLSRWAKGGALAAGALQVEDVERRLSQWTVEPFRVLASLLSTGLPTPQQQQQRNSSEGEDELRVLKHAEPGKHAAAPALHPAEAIDAHALFLLCLAAMKRWKRDFSLVHLLDSTSYSVRRTDPFVLASFLLHARDATTGAPVLSIAKVQALAHAAAPHFLGRVPHFLPLVDDTVESYAARLLRFATRHIHGLEPAAELLRSGSYAVGGGTDGASVSRRRRAVLDDAPPRRFRLRTLRRVKQQTLETADLQPLLYAADVHEYLNASRWTFLGTALHATYNALLYPFTSTTSESILSAMASRLQFIEPSEQQRVRLTYLGEGAAQGDAMKESGSSGDGEGKEDANRVSTSSSPASDSAGMPPLEEASSVSAFVSAFAEDAGLREHFIACQLLSFTLESGMPEGFSLLFYEATDRGNPYAQHLANFLADDVLGRWTASVWTEHHVSAQWQREKAGQPMDGSFLTLNTRSPFRYASVEGRQELFARLSRWKAARALAASAKSGQAKSAEALDHLLWCAGLLTRRAFYDTGRVHQMAFEGAIFPAADLQCVAEVSALIQREKRLRAAATGAGAEWSKEEWRQAQTNVTQLLRDLGDRLAFDYDLIDAPPARRLPPSEADYHRNLSDPAVTVPSTDLQHTPRKRFAQVSTQLVEPWNRRTREISVETLNYGEGTFYNGRLHRVSGHRWGAALQSWWLWLRHVFP